MTSCSAYGCTNRRSKKKSGISFHRFPVCPQRRAAWVRAVRRKDWQPSKCSCLCSEHFIEADFDRTSHSVVRLKENAVPTVFTGFSPYLQSLAKSVKVEPMHFQNPVIEHVVPMSSSNSPDHMYCLSPDSECRFKFDTNNDEMTEATSDDTKEKCVITNSSETNPAEDVPTLYQSILDSNVPKSLLIDIKICDTVHSNSAVVSSVGRNDDEKATSSCFSSFAKTRNCHTSVEELKRKLLKYERRRASDRLKIRKLQQNVRRYRKRIDILQSMLRESNYKKLIDEETAEILGDSAMENEIFTIVQLN